MSTEAAVARVGDLAALMDRWAPPWTAESWDRVGLLTGSAQAPVSLAWVALELDDALLEQALAHKVDMLLLHHPPLFKPLANLRSDRPSTARLLKAARQDLALFAAHTNLDAAPGGVNDALAQLLGLERTAPLAPAGQEGLAKLATFVPPDHYEEVTAALFAAGAGRVGTYQECAFVTPGTGTFLAPPDGNPYLGRAGQREQVSELRLETIIPLAQVEQALGALRLAHPYEEPAVDVYPLRQAPAGCGLGRIGRLAAPLPPGELARRAAQLVGAQAPLLAGHLDPLVERVAVLGGSGGDFLGLAKAAGAQMLITGEAGYHAAQEAQDLGLALLTLGHFQTEAVVVEPWARRLGQMLAEAGLACRVEPWLRGADPWRAVSRSDS
jgi:dinuclear metal center YbgI/SA1388 family protein